MSVKVSSWSRVYGPCIFNPKEYCLEAEDKLAMKEVFEDRKQALRYIREHVKQTIEEMSKYYNIKVEKLREGRRIKEVIITLELPPEEDRVCRLIEDHYEIEEVVGDGRVHL